MKNNAKTSQKKSAQQGLLVIAALTLESPNKVWNCNLKDKKRILTNQYKLKINFMLIL